MNLNDEERMLAQSLVICALFWTAATSLVFLPGCTQHKVDVSSSSVDRVVDRIAALQPPVQCRPISLPAVPQDVVLDIQGDKVTANAGGETLLRGYVACHSLYKDAQLTIEHCDSSSAKCP